MENFKSKQGKEPKIIFVESRVDALIPDLNIYHKDEIEGAVNRVKDIIPYVELTPEIYEWLKTKNHVPVVSTSNVPDTSFKLSIVKKLPDKEEVNEKEKKIIPLHPLPPDVWKTLAFESLGEIQKGLSGLTRAIKMAE
jgi:hypothetical protein